MFISMVQRRRGRPKGHSGQAPTLKQDEIKRVFRVAKSRPRFAARTEAVLAISLYLGLRAKEIASLRYGDVFDGQNQVRDVLHLKASYTKGAKTRDVFLTAPRLRQVLREYAQGSNCWRLPDAPLFRSQKGGTLSPASMGRFLKQLYVEAGLPEASSHTGRRTFITSLAERGIDLKSISLLAGHANIRTTAIYVDANPVRLSRILADVTW